MRRALHRSVVRRCKMNLVVDTDCALDDIFALSLLDSAPDVRLGYISTVNGLNNANDGAKTIQAMFWSSLYINKPTVASGVVPLPDQAKLSDINWYNEYQQSLQGIEKVIQTQFAGPRADESSRTVDSTNVSPTANSFLHSGSGQVFAGMGRGNPVVENVLLCLGPLTNIAALLKAQPDTLSSSISRLVIMGGAVHTSGNCAHGAEFNFYLDPQAAHDVIHHCGVPVELLSLDVANSQAFTPADIADIVPDNVFQIWDRTPGSESSFGNKAEFMRYLQKTFPDCACYDPVAAYYLVNSAAFVMEDVRVYVDPVTGFVHNCGNCDTHSDTVTVTEAMRRSAVVIKSAVSFDRASYVIHIRQLLNLS